MKARTIYILIAVVFTLIVVVTGGFYLYRLGGETPSQSMFSTNQAAGDAAKESDLEVDGAAGDYVPPEAPQEEPGIAIPGWGQIALPAGKTDVTVDFPNPEENAGQYYLTFALILKDTGETLYESELVPPGKTIQHITLSRPLDEGTYDAVVHVQPYRMDEQKTPTNNADMETKLIVRP